MNLNNDIMMKEYSSNNCNNNQQYTDTVSKIRVAVRKRPLNKKETSRNEMDIIEIKNGNTVIVKELK
jgi:hypothetical protein